MTSEVTDSPSPRSGGADPSGIPVLGILASGRGSNAEAIFAAIRSGRLAARAGVVLTDNPEAPVLDVAARFGVPGLHVDPGRPRARLTPEAEARYVDILSAHGVAWVALAGFMRILGPALLGAFPQRILNIHPSLLPAFPGLHAQRQAWEYGARVAGCTVHYVDAGVDTGPIVLQAAIDVRDDDTPESLAARILEREHETYVEALRLVLSGAARVEGRRVLRRPGG